MPPSSKARALGLAAEAGIMALLVFTPFAFGSVQPWASSVMETLSFLVLGIFLLKVFLNGGMGRLTPAYLAVPFVFFAVLVFIQAAPLPSGLVSIVSPGTYRIYGIFTDAGEAAALSLSRGETMDGFFRLLSYAAVFFVIVNHYGTKRQLGRLFGAIVLIGVGLAVFAVVQKLTWNGYLYWFYPLRPEVAARSSGIFGPYINKNHFAGYMVLATPLAMGFVLYNYSRADLRAKGALKRLAEFSTKAEFSAVVLYSLAAAVTSAALFMTLSRGGVLGFISSAIFFAALASARRSLKRGGLAAALVFALMLAFVLFLSWAGLEARFAEITGADGISRLDIWEDSIGMWRDFPVTGIGLGAFNSVYRLYQSKYPLVTFEHAENDYVELLVETGALGAAAFAALIILFFYVTIGKWRSRHGGFVKCMALGGLSSCAAILVHSLTDFNMRIPANAMTLTVIAAATYATLFNVPGRLGAEGEPKAEPGRRQGRKYPLSVAAILIPAVLLFFPVKGLVSEYFSFIAYAAIDDRATDYRDSKPISPETLPDYLKAAQRLETASYISKNRSGYYKDAAGIYAALARWNEAMSHADAEEGTTGLVSTGIDTGALYAKALFNLEKAVALDPVNPWYHLTAAGVHEDFHHGSGLGEKHLRMAVSAYPVNVEVRYVAAREHLKKGRLKEAAAEAAVVAKTDESYIIKGGPFREMVLTERGRAYYKNYGGSYLYRALEIIWRAEKDINAVKEACPGNPDAAEVLQLFLEQKGLSE